MWLEDGPVWFKKSLTGHICVIVEFQPSSLEIADFFDFAVNLTRSRGTPLAGREGRCNFVAGKSDFST
jgi:hypothetical protein